MAVLEPVKLVIENWAEVFGSDDHLEPCHAPVHPHHPELGQRHFMLGRELWIERYGVLSPIGSIIRQEARWCSTASRA